MTLLVAVERCRICGCTNELPCIWNDIGGDQNICDWFDIDHTLCTNPRCIAQIPLDELLQIAA